MFTGIIEAKGIVRAILPVGDARRFVVEAPFAGELRVDESVAVNGACMTVVACNAHTFAFVTIEESLSKTALGDLKVGDAVNLERALQVGSRLDGHYVLGHVDTTGTVASVEAQSASWLIRIAYPAAFAPYLIPVGSIAVDGTSLTIARLEDDHFTVAIIPHTWEKTILSSYVAGRRVNLEFDILGKYALRALQVKAIPGAQS